MSNLRLRHCEPCKGEKKALTAKEVQNLLPQLADNWEVRNNFREISCSFKFANFHETMAFVNAIAWIANKENHHPDLEIGYNYCNVRFTTHALQGLSMNDFICAAKIDLLLL